VVRDAGGAARLVIRALHDLPFGDAETVADEALDV
jgi:hypothetical protein